MRSIKPALFLAILMFTIMGILSITSPEAQGHRPNPSRCQAVSQQAPPGFRYRALQQCLGYVKQHQIDHVCQLPMRPLIGTRVTVKGRKATRHQRRVLTTILNIGRAWRVEPKVQIAAVATTTQEASAMELRYGHGTSVGPMQLISMHGTFEQRVRADFSARWFFRRAINVNHHHPYLSVNDLSQRVQKSAHPNAYARWVPEARRTYRTFLGPCRR